MHACTCVFDLRIVEMRAALDDCMGHWSPQTKVGTRSYMCVCMHVYACMHTCVFDLRIVEMRAALDDCVGHWSPQTKAGRCSPTSAGSSSPACWCGTHHW